MTTINKFTAKVSILNPSGYASMVGLEYPIEVTAHVECDYCGDCFAWVPFEELKKHGRRYYRSDNPEWGLMFVCMDEEQNFEIVEILHDGWGGGIIMKQMDNDIRIKDLIKQELSDKLSLSLDNEFGRHMGNNLKVDIMYEGDVLCSATIPMSYLIDKGEYCDCSN